MRCCRSSRWLVLMAVEAGLFLITIDHSVLYTTLPTLTRELHATATQSLWIINAYPLVIGSLLLGFGTLGDRIGHRRMFLAGLFLFGIASLVAAFSPSAAMLIAARAFLAVGAASIMPATLALIRLTFVDERERNIALSVWGSFSVIGAVLGPIIGGLLLEHFWWGSVFLINVPVAIVAFIVAYFFVPKGEGDSSKPWDVISSLQSLIVLFAVVLAIKEAAHRGTSWTIPVVALIVALITATFFVRRQQRLPFPLLDFAVFRNRVFSSGVCAVVFALFAVVGLELATILRFQLVADFTPVEAGLLLMVSVLGSIPAAILAGAWVHRLGVPILMVGGLAIGAISVLLMIYGVTHGLIWLIVGLVIMGAGLGATMAVASSAIMGNSPVDRAGMASSIEEVSYELGNLLAVATIGSLLSYFYTANVVLPAGTPELARDSLTTALAISNKIEHGAVLRAAATAAYDGGYFTVMYIAAVILALSALLTALLLGKPKSGSATSSDLPPH